MKKHFVVIVLLILAVLAIPISFFLKKPLELRSRAAASTLLYFSPGSSSVQPIQLHTGNPLALDIMMNPGTNAISILKLQVQFDPNKFQAGVTPLVINQSAFSTVVEGPVIDSANGNILVTLSVGSDPTKAIRTTTKIATVNLIALAPSDITPTLVSFGSQSQAFSVAAGDQPYENVLATAMPSYVVIAQGPTPTPLPGQISPTDTPLPTETPFPTETISPQDTTFTFTAFLHGIGNSGDSTNPNGTSFSNKNPQRQQRTLDIFVFNASGQQVVNTQGTINYDSTHGFYSGTIDLGTALPIGSYTVKIKTDSYLRRLIPGIVKITSSATSLPLPAVTMVAGDVNNDNTINILDYNMLMGCYSDILPAAFCDSTRQGQTDLNDDGAVNQFDYNLFLREITVQNGD